MKNNLDYIRFGSAEFLYIISLFVLVNIFGKLCTDIVSVVSFIFFSLLLTITVFPKDISSIGGVSDKIVILLIIIAVIAGTITEIGISVSAFELSSDKVNSAAGKYVFSVIITAVAFICSLTGRKTVIKMSNILFFIPLVAFIAVVPAAVENGLDLTVFRSANQPATSESILNGIITSLITVSDVYIISIMQIRKKCYKKDIAVKSFVFTILFMTLISMFYSALFGERLYSKLNIPLISAVGSANRFDFEEIIAFVYSICLLYRITAKMSFIAGEIKTLTNKKSSRIITGFIFIAAGLFGVFTNSHKKVSDITDMIVPIISFISFFFIPLTLTLIKKINYCRNTTNKTDIK